MKYWVVLIMLSIKPISGGGQANYYVTLAADDYYASEGPGRWIGSGAQALGFVGSVTGSALKNAFAGTSINGDRQLVQLHKARRPGYDLTFSAPKEVSILWAFGDAKITAACWRAHQHAVAKAIAFVEAELLLTRSGKGGVHRLPAKVVAAAFDHFVSREHDMQLHTHVLVINVAVRPDGTTGAIEAKRVVESKLLVGRIYQDALASELEKSLGLRFERKGDVLALVDFPGQLKDAFSTRRAQIVAEMTLRGVDGGKAAAVAALATRKAKSHRPLHELRNEWIQEARMLGFEPSRLLGDVLAAQAKQPCHVDRLGKIEAKLRAHQQQQVALPSASLVPAAPNTPSINMTVTASQSSSHSASSKQRTAPKPLVSLQPATPSLPSQRSVPANLTAATKLASPSWFARYMARRAIRQATALSSHFSVREVLELSVNDRLCRRYNFEKLLDDVPFELKRWSQIVGLGVHRGENRYTTKEIIRIEKKFIRLVNDSQRSSWHRCRIGGVLAAPLRGRNVSPEQWAAIREITSTPKAIAVLEGGAGTGKTTTIAEAAKIWKASAYDVRGAAISGKAAKELESATNLPSDTITRTLWDARRGRIRFHPLSLVVVDEAGMADTRQLYELCRRVRRGRGKVVLVGSAEQLQPVISGNSFARILQSFGGAKLQTVVRQRHAWLREAVRDFAEGRADKALAAFRQRGCIVTDKNRDRVVERLVADWRQLRKIQPKRRIILCGTKEDARRINQAIQHDKRLSGELGKLSIKVGDERLHRGDRVVCTKNSRRLGLRNGDMGKVVAVIPPLQHLIVKLDNGKYKFIPTLVYRDLQLGEAITTHRAQGMTVERSQVFVGGRINRELTYVQASRARSETRFYVDPKFMPYLERNMSRSEKKTLAIDLQDRQKSSRHQKQELQR